MLLAFPNSIGVGLVIPAILFFDCCRRLPLDTQPTLRLRSLGNSANRDDKHAAQALDMMRRLAHHLAWACLGVFLSGVVVAQTNAPASTDLAKEEKESCTRNLKTIYQAVQAYQLDHKDLPNWLSDLVPQYLPDDNVLICPVCWRTGQTEAAPLADPKLPSSYLFEFNPLPLGNTAPKAPNQTRREWKRRQMGLVGSMVPIVRCRHHNPVLNLAFDGTIYESPPMWEQALTNRARPADLTAARLFAREATSEEPTPRELTPRQFPARDPNTPEQCLNLTKFYNAMLTESWHGGTSNTLDGLPGGLQAFGGTRFDVRGIIQLGSKSTSATNFPAELHGIGVHQKCRRIQFLHAAGWGNPPDAGKHIADYIVRFATNQMRIEIPVDYGPTVLNWHTRPGEGDAAQKLNVVWTGENGISRKEGNKLRLFQTTWTNPVPDFEVETIDCVSAMSTPALFVIAITVE